MVMIDSWGPWTTRKKSWNEPSTLLSCASCPCFLKAWLTCFPWLGVGTCWNTIKMMTWGIMIVVWLSELLNAQDCKISRHLNLKFLDAAAHFIVWPSSWPLPNPGSSRVVGTTESNWQLRRPRRARGPRSHGWGAKMPRQKWGTEGSGDMVIECNWMMFGIWGLKWLKSWDLPGCQKEPC